MEGYIHSIEMGSSVDGPGLRATVFTTGCPLQCQYCHNPDTRHLKDGTLRSVESIMEEITPYIPFLTQNRGGLTLSGGEPLVQPAFTTEVFKAAKELGLHTALDTSGNLGAHATEELLEHTDLVLLDIKSGLPETYTEVTGANLAPTLTFAERLSRMGKPMWVRYVLVPGLTDAEPNIRTVGAFLKTLNNVERVEVLPFHNMGKHKWKECGLPYKLENTPSPSTSEVEKAYQLLTS